MYYEVEKWYSDFLRKKTQSVEWSRKKEKDLWMKKQDIGSAARVVKMSSERDWKKWKKPQNEEAGVVINMKFKKMYNNIKHNYTLMMALCCGIPLLLLYVAIYIFDVSRSYMYWLIILLCPIMHLLMMKDMNKKHIKDDKKKKHLPLSYEMRN